MTFPLLWSELQPLLDEQHTCQPYIFIETGVYLGATLTEMDSHFSDIAGIELGLMHILEFVKTWSIYRGDSAELLPLILNSPELKWNPCVIYLDAHWWRDADPPVPYSDNPLLAELAAIRLHNQADFVVIDDAQLFGISREECERQGVDVAWTGITVASVRAALGPSRIAGYNVLRRNHTPDKKHMWLSLRRI